MPRVGKKHFAYTAGGMKAAKAEAKKTGKPMKMHEKTEGKKERAMEYGSKKKGKRRGK